MNKKGMYQIYHLCGSLEREDAELGKEMKGESTKIQHKKGTF